jgi:hypothetical protein
MAKKRKSTNSGRKPAKAKSSSGTPQPECPTAEPQKEHAWLQKFVGKWTFEAECAMGPDQPPSKCKGSENVRSLGGLWTLAEGRGEMPGGGAATTLMTLGYDPQKKRYVGTWIGSMMTHLWAYDGALDASGEVLTLNTEGPNMAVPGTIAKYKDVIEFKSRDRRSLTSHMLGNDGKWCAFMTARYRRHK